MIHSSVLKGPPFPRSAYRNMQGKKLYLQFFAEIKEQILRSYRILIRDEIRFSEGDKFCLCRDSETKINIRTSQQIIRLQRISLMSQIKLTSSALHWVDLRTKWVKIVRDIIFKHYFRNVYSVERCTHVSSPAGGGRKKEADIKNIFFKWFTTT